jgi:cobalt-precorrin 5A hydrolase/precorrin-3B C17-methyltransferase
VTREAAPRGAAVICLTAGGRATAARVLATLPGARLHGLAGRIDQADVRFDDTMAHLRALFSSGTPIVGVCAAGILIRAVAPLLADKTVEPPVVAVAEDGSAVVPLLGGHHGANRLARTLADALGVPAAVTTASDLAGGAALDDPPPGWRLANPDAAKPIAAALLAGQPIGLTVEAGDARWLDGLTFSKDARPAVHVTHLRVVGGADLVLHPPVLALGVGTERGVDAAELGALVDATLTQHGLSPHSIACVASIDLKADEHAVHALAQQLGVPARFFTAARLNDEAPRLENPSDAVLRETGCPGVAEGAALAAAGSDSILIVPKTRGARTTCAVALAQRDIDPLRAGQARGSLAIVGIGPGDLATRTLDAVTALRDAEDVVGYGLYLALIADLIAGKPQHATALGEESARVRQALELAAAGRRVALVSSGDAGIYGLASLAFELIEHESRPDWRRVALSVVPGVSALQAAAAQLGAPLGHDFCAISLSDLLTPWDQIERRLAAAAAADFVIALYNPRSARRSWQLERACAILGAHRSLDTPVGVARNLGRAGEQVVATTLGALDFAQIDMLSLVLIGSTTTRRVELPDGPRLYTPRGYAAKPS